MQITDSTTIQIGLVIVLAAATTSWGIIFAKVQALEKAVDRLEAKLDEVLGCHKK